MFTKGSFLNSLIKPIGLYFVILQSPAFLFAQTQNEMLAEKVQSLDPHRGIRPLFDPDIDAEGLSLSTRLFPLEVKKSFESTAKKSIEDSTVKRALLKTIALRAIPEFQNQLDGLSNLQQFGTWMSAESVEQISSKISWSDFYKRIKAWAPLSIENPTAEDTLHYLEALDREFSIPEKVTLVVAIHLQYLNSMRASLSETQSAADLTTLMKLEKAMEVTPDLCRQFLEVDADYRLRKIDSALALLLKYADRGDAEFQKVESRVLHFRKFSTFAHFTDEAVIFRNLLAKQLRREIYIQGSDLSIPVVAYATVFERLADSNDPSIWDWTQDPDLNRIGEIMKSARGSLDEGERRWILESNRTFRRLEFAQKFEAERGQRGLEAATKNSAWFIPVASTLLFRAWWGARSLIQLSDQMFRDEAVLIAQAVANKAGSPEAVTNLVASLAKPAALQTSSFAQHLAVGLGAREMGREAALFIPAQPITEIAAKIPKGLNPAAVDAITAAVQQRQYIQNFADYISKVTTNLPNATRYQATFQNLISQTLAAGTERSAQLAARLAGGFTEIKAMSKNAAEATAIAKTASQTAKVFGTADIAIELLPIESRVSVAAARKILQSQLAGLNASETADIAVYAKKISEIHREIMSIVKTARYEMYLQKVAAINQAAENGSAAAKAIAPFHRLATRFAYQIGRPIAYWRVGRLMRGMQYESRSGISGWLDSFRSVTPETEFHSTTPGMLSKSSKVMKLGGGIFRNLPLIAAGVGAAVYGWQVYSAYYQGDADQEFEAYQKRIQNEDAAKGISSDALVQKKMKPKNIDGIATALYSALNYAPQGVGESLNQKRTRLGLPTLEIVMNPESMAPLDPETGFATYAHALLKVKESQKKNSESERARNIQNGILIRFYQKRIGDPLAPKEVYWVFDRAAILNSENDELQKLVAKTVHGTGDMSVDVQIQTPLANQVFSQLASLWPAP